jgi:hypothetical protein
MQRLSSISVRGERPECPTKLNRCPFACPQGRLLHISAHVGQRDERPLHPRKPPLGLRWIDGPSWVGYGSSVLVDGRRRAALVIRLCAAS